ncbi:MAG: GNAT family N-acetyltransferase [Ruminococcus sp.]|nr:GNAT family N-acetyltransferase [Ruminococcus sp.]
MALTIEKITADEELREVSVLAEKIWHECFVGIISEAQIDYMVGKFQSYNAMKEQISDQGYSYYAVRDNGDICGYIGMKPEEGSRFFLSKLYLRKDKRNKGIASQMLEKVISEAKAAGKSSVYLTVNKHNRRAIDVYIKKGFRMISDAVTDIGGGFVMDDYIMEYFL